MRKGKIVGWIDRRKNRERYRKEEVRNLEGPIRDRLNEVGNPAVTYTAV